MRKKKKKKKKLTPKQKLENFSSVEKLILNWNEIKSIPQGIFEKLKKLKEINLMGTRGIDMVQFAENLSTSNIKKVDFSRVQFQNQEIFGKIVQEEKKK